MRYNHIHFGDFAEIMVLQPCWPICDVATFKVYAWHNNGKEALEHWFSLTRRVTSRRCTSKAYGYEDRGIDILLDKIMSITHSKANPYKAKYNHFVFPNNLRTYNDKDIDVEDRICNQIEWKYPNANIYKVDIDRSISIEDMPIMLQIREPLNKHLMCWQQAMSFLNDLSWPLTLTHTSPQAKDHTIDDRITANLLELPLTHAAQETTAEADE